MSPNIMNIVTPPVWRSTLDVSESDVYIRQILTSNVDPCAVRFNQNVCRSLNEVQGSKMNA